MLPTLSRTASALMAAVVVGGCGYQPVRTASSRAEAWCVTSGPEPGTHPQAVVSLEFGARDTLAQRDRLVSCDQGATLVIQVLDVRFEPVGIVAQQDDPSARSTRVKVTATAHVRSEGQRKDLGVVTEEYVVANGSTPMAEENARAVGVVSAARRAGESLARRLLGEPVQSANP